MSSISLVTPQSLFAEVLSSFHVRPRFLRVSAYALLFSFFFVVGFMGPGVFSHAFSQEESVVSFGWQAIRLPRCYLKKTDAVLREVLAVG